MANTQPALTKEVSALGRVNEEYRGLSHQQREYYEHTSGDMLPRHHNTLLPLARVREGPNYQ